MEKKQNKFDPYAPHRIKWWGWPLLLLLIVGTVYVFRTETKTKTKTKTETETGEWKAESVQRCEGSIFGTFYHITYCHDKDVKEDLESVLKEVDNTFSTFNPGSIISAINANKPVKCNRMFMDVLVMSKNISAETDGSFDITVAPLVNLWGFGFKHEEAVSQEKVDSLLRFVGLEEKVSMEGDSVVKSDPGVMLDCSAIAKGYGVDEVGRHLDGIGVKNYMVEIGGEVRVRGHNPKGELWKIGVSTPEDDPTGQNRDIEKVLEVTQMSIATSGNYRNFYEKDGKKYAHTIDPRTGYPVQHSILSSTVLAEECAVADAYATAFMVMGFDDARKVLDKHPELKAFFIYNDEKGSMQTWTNYKLD